MSPTFPHEITREILQWFFIPHEFSDRYPKSPHDNILRVCILMEEWMSTGVSVQLVCREWRSLTREMLAKKMVILYDGSTVPAYADVERAKHVWWIEEPRDLGIADMKVSHRNYIHYLSSQDYRLGRPFNVPRSPYPFQHLRTLRLDLVESPPYLKKMFSPLEKGGTIVFPVLEHLDLYIAHRILDFLLPWSTPSLRVVTLETRSESNAHFWFLEPHLKALCKFLTRHAAGLHKIRIGESHLYALLGYLAPSRLQATYEVTFCELWAFHRGLAARYGVDKDAVWQGHVILNLKSLGWARMGTVAYMGPKTTTLLVRSLEPWSHLSVYLGQRKSRFEGGDIIVRGLSEQCFIATDCNDVRFCRDVADFVLS